MADSLPIIADESPLHEDIEQTRQIRAEQDKAYEESLQIDREKVHIIVYFTCMLAQLFVTL